MDTDLNQKEKAPKDNVDELLFLLKKIQEAVNDK